MSSLTTNTVASLLLAGLLAAPVAGQETSAPLVEETGCYPRSMWLLWLHEEHDLRLHSWGLMDNGYMVELLLRSDGHFAILTTTPKGCTRASMPAKERGRLVEEQPFGDRPLPSRPPLCPTCKPDMQPGQPT